MKALENMEAKEIEEYFDAEPGELEGMLNDIESIMEEAGLLSEEIPATSKHLTEIIE